MRKRNPPRARACALVCVRPLFAYELENNLFKNVFENRQKNFPLRARDRDAARTRSWGAINASAAALTFVLPEKCSLTVTKSSSRSGTEAPFDSSPQRHHHHHHHYHHHYRSPSIIFFFIPSLNNRSKLSKYIAGARACACEAALTFLPCFS